MTESELRAVPPFDALPVEPEDAADYLSRPDDPKFQGTVYEAGDVPMVKDFLRDPQLVQRGRSVTSSGPSGRTSGNCGRPERGCGTAILARSEGRAGGR